MLYYFIAIIIIILDQASKWMIVKTMDYGEQIPVIENFFYITSHRNQGAAWGILQGQMGFFYIVTLIVIAVVGYYLYRYARTNALMGWSLALILGGAIGNFIDRLLRGEVVDFLDIYVGNYDYPIFNVADSSLVVGVILVLIATFLDDRKKGRS